MENGQNIRIIVILLQSASLNFYKSSRVCIVRSVASASALTGFIRHFYILGLQFFNNLIIIIIIQKRSFVFN